MRIPARTRSRRSARTANSSCRSAGSKRRRSRRPWPRPQQRQRLAARDAQGARLKARDAGAAALKVANPGNVVRHSHEGCECRKVWRLAGDEGQDCTNYCCNPDGDEHGDWCFHVDADCASVNWGYCTQGETAETFPTTVHEGAAAGEPCSDKFDVCPTYGDYCSAGLYLFGEAILDACPHTCGTCGPREDVDCFDLKGWVTCQTYGAEYCDVSNGGYIDGLAFHVACKATCGLC